MIFIGFRKVKVLSIQSKDWMIKSKILHNIWRLLKICQYYGMNVLYFMYLFWWLWTLNFVHLPAIFASALHIVLCQIVWCQIVLKSSKCSNVNIFKCSTFLMFQCSNNQMLKFSNIKMFKCSNVQMFKCLNVQIFKCSNVPIFQRFNVPMFQWSNVQMFKCWNI